MPPRKRVDVMESNTRIKRRLLAALDADEKLP
jgi:hypothetical protein